MQQPAQIIKLDEAMQYAGKRFLTMVSGSNATDSELSSFPADLRQHLTELNLTLEPFQPGPRQQTLHSLCSLIKASQPCPSMHMMSTKETVAKMVASNCAPDVVMACQIRQMRRPCHSVLV